MSDQRKLKNITGVEHLACETLLTICQQFSLGRTLELLGAVINGVVIEKPLTKEAADLSAAVAMALFHMADALHEEANRDAVKKLTHPTPVRYV